MLVAADLSSGGGVNKVIRELAMIFSDRLGFEVSVLNARSADPPTYPFPAQVRIEHNRAGRLASHFKALWRLRKTRPDVVIGSWTQDNILLVLAFLFSSTRVVLVEHASWHFHARPIRWLRRAVYPLASHLVVLNRGDLRYYSTWLDRVVLIPDPVTAPGGAPVQAPRQKLVLAVGHLEPAKNFADAIRAMHQSALEDHGWSLAIIGSGSSEPALRGLIADLGLQRTHIHPPTDDLESWHRRTSLLLLPSRAESFSLVLAEAMLSGVVPIAYATDGPSFILEDFPDHLVDIGDVSALAERLAHFANAPQLDPLRAQLAASIHARFSPTVVAQLWGGLLSELIESGKRR